MLISATSFSYIDKCNGCQCSNGLRFNMINCIQVYDTRQIAIDEFTDFVRFWQPGIDNARIVAKDLWVQYGNRKLQFVSAEQFLRMKGHIFDNVALFCGLTEDVVLQKFITERASFKGE